MKFFINFLLISSLSIIIVIAERIPHLSTARIRNLIREDPPPPFGLPRTIKLLQEGEISRDGTVVWKGKYKNYVDVAIKIFNDQEVFQCEKQAYEKLNATANGFDSVAHRIPRVYYCGPIFGHFDAIVMTLFENNLEYHFRNQGLRFSDSTILLIFKQVVEALKYIHSKEVFHGVIILRNIYIRLGRLYIAGFDVAQLDEVDFLSSDYKALLAIVWRMVNNANHSRQTIYDQVESFKDPTIQTAFHYILHIGKIPIRNYALPDYDEIIRIADGALAQIGSQPEPVQFDWLRTGSNPSSGESSKS